jgi:hypothetical protein
VLPPGPSRTIKAVYGGAPRTLGSSGTATAVVPARIDLSITPRQLPWPDFIRVRGHLDGGYVPPNGVALRFLVRYPHSHGPSTLLALRTNSLGQFEFTWSYNAGNGIATYPMSVATTATESDYPFAAATSRAIPVTWGAPTPARKRQRK